jgi:hypothetical protein
LSAYTQAKKFNKQNRFPELHHPEDHQLVEFVKNLFVSINSTLRLYHELLRNKHNEILLEIASGVRQHTPKLKNPTSKIDFKSYITPKIINS